MLNCHSECLWWLRLVLRLLLVRGRLPPLWIDKLSLFINVLSQKGLIGGKLLCLYDLHITTKLLGELFKHLVILKFSTTESVIRRIFEDVSDLTKVLRLEVSGTLKFFIINQDLCTSICNILPWINLDFETITMINCRLKTIIGFGENVVMVVT